MSLILPRRELLKGVSVLGGSLLLPRAGRANVIGNGPTWGGWSPSPRLIKPIWPMRINWRHPLAQGLMVDMVDIGGTIIDLARGYHVKNGNVMPVQGQSPYGGGFNWPGPAGDTLGYGAYISVGYINESDAESQISVVSNLAGLGAGAGFTISTMFYCTDVTQYSHLWGRPAEAQEAAPFSNWQIFLRGADATPGVAVQINNNGTYNYVGGTTGGTVPNNIACTNNTLTHCACTFLNTSAGVCTATQYQQGIQVNQSTGVVLTGTNTTPGQDSESQLMLATVYHEDTGQAFFPLPGWAYFGRMRSYALTPDLIAWEKKEPWCMYEPAEGELPEMAQATSSGTVVPFSFLPPFGTP